MKSSRLQVALRLTCQKSFSERREKWQHSCGRHGGLVLRTLNNLLAKQKERRGPENEQRRTVSDTGLHRVRS